MEKVQSGIGIKCVYSEIAKYMDCKDPKNVAVLIVGQGVQDLAEDFKERVDFAVGSIDYYPANDMLPGYVGEIRFPTPSYDISGKNVLLVGTIDQEMNDAAEVITNEFGDPASIDKICLG